MSNLVDTNFGSILGIFMGSSFAPSLANYFGFMHKYRATRENGERI